MAVTLFVIDAWKEGLSVTVIAERASALPDADRVINKNMIIGMVHRLELDQRRPPAPNRIYNAKSPRYLRDRERARARKKDAQLTPPVAPVPDVLVQETHVPETEVVKTPPVVIADPIVPPAPVAVVVPIRRENQPLPTMPVVRPVRPPADPARVVTMLFPVTGPTPRTCQFPIGDPKQKDFRFCGDPTKGPGFVYCGEHHKLCYVRLPPRRDAA